LIGRKVADYMCPAMYSKYCSQSQRMNDWFGQNYPAAGLPLSSPPPEAGAAAQSAPGRRGGWGCWCTSAAWAHFNSTCTGKGNTHRNIFRLILDDRGLWSSGRTVILLFRRLKFVYTKQ
jgi:hypothetical protein